MSDIYGEIRSAWETHAVTKLRMNAGQALSRFDHFIEGLCAQSEHPSSENAYTGLPLSEVVRSEPDLMDRLKESLCVNGPSDAQVLAALNSYMPLSTTSRLSDYHPSRVEAMRAALLAAAEVGRSLAAFQQISDAEGTVRDASRWPCGCRYSIYELTHPDEGHVDGDHRPDAEGMQ